ncbi:MAG: RNA pseudouridine synthase [Myxococcales bacterium]|nr:RNA pseudouridine synthase [Myxococcales bacterium]MCB9753963.1 RNA pseudouridine synthase [Myxococcales bacterium]
MFVAGDRAPPSRRVAFGESIEFQWYERRLERSPAELVVLATTPRFVYAHKPPGLHTHRLQPNQPLALADLVVQRFPECRAASSDPREGGAIHRLDGETSGVVAFARSRSSWERARAGFEAQRVGKLYLGLCRARRSPPWPPETPRGWGYSLTPGALVHERLLDEASAETRAALDPRGELTSLRGEAPFVGEGLELRVPLGQGSRRGEVAIRPDGRPSRSLLRPLVITRPSSTGDSRVLLAIELVTGQRHQARAHLAWLGLPLEGDAVYADAGDSERLHLHALAIDLSAIFKAEREVLAPVPEGFYAPLRDG